MLSPSKVRREIAMVFGVSLLALVPVLYLWRKSAISPKFQKGTSASTWGVAPILTPAPGQGASEAHLSPDGRWVARLESALLPPGASTSTNSTSVADQLVVRSTSNGREVFRDFGTGRFVGWAAGTSDFVTQNDLSIRLYTPIVSTGATSARRPSTNGFWTSATITLPATSPDPAYDLQQGVIAFSPDLRFAVKATWDKGIVKWIIADLQTGKIAPPISLGRWLNYDPNVGGNSDDIRIAVAPAGVVKGALPLVTLLQSSKIKPKYNPHPAATPTATPPATPSPTPTYSPAQAQFMQRKQKEEADIQKIVDSVMGVDGSDPTVTDEAEIQRLTAEVKRRNQALQDENDRMFPLQKQQRDTLAAAAKARQHWSETLADADPFQVEAFDLNTRKRLWKAPLVTEVFMPGHGFSPDGKSLLAWGTAALVKGVDGTQLEDGYFDCLAPLTGKLRGRNHLRDGSFRIATDSDQLFYSDLNTHKSVLALHDTYWENAPIVQGKTPTSKYNSVLRFFDPTNAHEISYLKYLAPFDGDISAPPSTDQFGETWLLGNRTLTRLSRSQLGQENSGPLPTATPLQTVGIAPQKP